MKFHKKANKRKLKCKYIGPRWTTSHKIIIHTQHIKYFRWKKNIIQLDSKLFYINKKSYFCRRFWLQVIIYCYFPSEMSIQFISSIGNTKIYNCNFFFKLSMFFDLTWFDLSRKYFLVSTIGNSNHFFCLYWMKMLKN